MTAPRSGLWVPAVTFGAACLLSILVGPPMRLSARWAGASTSPTCRHDADTIPGVAAVVKVADGTLLGVTLPEEGDFGFTGGPKLPPHVQKATVVAKGRDGSLCIRVSAKDNTGLTQDVTLTRESNRGEVGFTLTSGSAADCCHEGRYSAFVESAGYVSIEAPSPFTRGEARIGGIVGGPMISEAKAEYDQNCNGIIDHERRVQKALLDAMAHRMGRNDPGAGIRFGFVETQRFLKDDNTIIEFIPNRRLLNHVEIGIPGGFGGEATFDRSPMQEDRKFRERESTRFEVTQGTVRAFSSRGRDDRPLPDVTSEMSMNVSGDLFSSDVTEEKINRLKKQ